MFKELSKIKIIIGLGNPGKRYEGTYHNVGFLAVDYLSKNPLLNFPIGSEKKANTSLFSTTRPTCLSNSGGRGELIEETKFHKFKLLKAGTHMNESGNFVDKTLKKYHLQPQEVLIVHDDSDIELGKYKISFGRSSAGHQGVESVIRKLKTKNFWRLRIGIRRNADKRGLETQINADNISINQRKNLRESAAFRMKAGEFVLKKINSRDKKTLAQAFEEIGKKFYKQPKQS